MPKLTDLTLLEARAMLRARELSAVELTNAYLDRVTQLNPQVNAYITVAADQARAAAAAADRALASGDNPGPLHGIPVALKDLFETRGLRTTAGSKILNDYIPTQDATVVTRLHAAGAILLGKLNMHEYAFGATNENPHVGNARNPWNLTHITGGSSGGSGAAIAARMALGTLGSDTGGSIRIPASLCGVTGIKPTYGRVSLNGVIPLSWFNDHAGPLTRTAADAALMLQVIAGYDAADPASIDREVPDFTSPRPDLRGLRFSVQRGYFVRDVSPEIIGAVEAAAKVLETLGAERVDTQIPGVQDMFAANRTMLGGDAAAYHRERLASRPDDFGPDVLKRLQNGARTPVEDYALARRKQTALRRELELYFQDVDLAVTPTTRIVAPEAGSLDPVMLAQHLTGLTAPFNVTGVPAISIPCGFTTDGLPIGLQLVTRPWNEGLLLQAAALYQSITDWHTRTPDLAQA